MYTLGELVHVLGRSSPVGGEGERCHRVDWVPMRESIHMKVSREVIIRICRHIFLEKTVHLIMFDSDVFIVGADDSLLRGTPALLLALFSNHRRHTCLCFFGKTWGQQNGECPHGDLIGGGRRG